MKRRHAGFTLVELLVVLSILMITSGIAVIKMKASITLLDADKAAEQVTGALRYARQVALDDRRDVLVEFINNNEIKITRRDSPTPTVMSDASLPSGYTFSLPGGVPDTPDGYGNSSAVNFNMQNNGVFRGDGIFTDDAGIVVNGTVFTMNGSNSTARAVTLTGATGRLKTYLVSGATWVTH
jgi:prepilin-type N-terminal cleavage/methylation domain-containing protein